MCQGTVGTRAYPNKPSTPDFVHPWSWMGRQRVHPSRNRQRPISHPHPSRTPRGSQLWTGTLSTDESQPEAELAGRMGHSKNIPVCPWRGCALCSVWGIGKPATSKHSRQQLLLGDTPHPGHAWRSAAPASWPSIVPPPRGCLRAKLPCPGCQGHLASLPQALAGWCEEHPGEPQEWMDVAGAQHGLRGP